MPIEVISLDFKNINNLFIAKTLSKINHEGFVPIIDKF